LFKEKLHATRAAGVPRLIVAAIQPERSTASPPPDVVGVRSIGELVETASSVPMWRPAGLASLILAMFLAVETLGWVVPAAIPPRPLGMVSSADGQLENPIRPAAPGELYAALQLMAGGCSSLNWVAFRSSYFAHRNVPLDGACSVRIALVPPTDKSIGDDDGTVITLYKNRTLPWLELPPIAVQTFSMWRVQRDFQRRLEETGK
jgi:hypothetical protein